jgi:hypothetical protein
LRLVPDGDAPEVLEIPGAGSGQPLTLQVPSGGAVTLETRAGADPFSLSLTIELPETPFLDSPGAIRLPFLWAEGEAGSGSQPVIAPDPSAPGWPGFRIVERHLQILPLDDHL